MLSIVLSGLYTHLTPFTTLRVKPQSSSWLVRSWIIYSPAYLSDLSIQKFSATSISFWLFTASMSPSASCLSKAVTSLISTLSYPTVTILFYLLYFLLLYIYFLFTMFTYCTFIINIQECVSSTQAETIFLIHICTVPGKVLSEHL